MKITNLKQNGPHSGHYSMNTVRAATDDYFLLIVSQMFDYLFGFIKCQMLNLNSVNSVYCLI